MITKSTVSVLTTNIFNEEQMACETFEKQL